MGQVYVRKVGEIYERKNIYTIKIYIIKKKKMQFVGEEAMKQHLLNKYFYLSHNHSLDGTYNGCKRHTLLH